MKNTEFSKKGTVAFPRLRIHGRYFPVYARIYLRPRSMFNDKILKYFSGENASVLERRPLPDHYTRIFI